MEGPGHRVPAGRMCPMPRTRDQRDHAVSPPPWGLDTPPRPAPPPGTPTACEPIGERAARACPELPQELPEAPLQLRPARPPVVAARLGSEAVAVEDARVIEARHAASADGRAVSTAGGRSSASRRSRRCPHSRSRALAPAHCHSAPPRCRLSRENLECVCGLPSRALPLVRRGPQPAIGPLCIPRVPPPGPNAEADWLWCA